MEAALCRVRRNAASSAGGHRAKRKFTRTLRRPSFQLITPGLDVGERVGRRLANLRRVAGHFLLRFATNPLPGDILEKMYDQLGNAIITFLSIYYLTGCSRAMEALICQNSDYVVVGGANESTSLEPRQTLLTASNNQVTCRHFLVWHKVLSQHLLMCHVPPPP